MSQVIITALQQGLGHTMVLTGEQLAHRYHHIWKMNEPLQAVAVVLPTSTADVSAAMAICHKHSQPVVVHGGLTNLVGSTETTGTEVVISTEKLNTIEEVDQQGRTITVQSGVILEHIQQAAEEVDLELPINFGAKGSAQIGGVISTNAGGLRVFRYGMTRQSVLGIEAVLADGTVISSMKKLIKDNSAYDLKQLFIGSEGTLGIITKAVLKLIEAPQSRSSAFAAFDEYRQVVSFLKYMDRGLAGTLSGYELIWGQTYQQMTSPSTVRCPLPNGYKYYVLLDALGSNQAADDQLLMQLMERAVTDGMLSDAVVSHTAADVEWFWGIREDVHVVASACTYDQHFDVSLPITDIGSYVDEVVQRVEAIEGVRRCYPFGHVADGNVHFIVDKQDESVALKEAIDRVVYSPLTALGGSVSAEHGIGLHKRKYLPLCRTTEEIQLMHTIKRAMDPRGILNPGKVLR